MLTLKQGQGHQTWYGSVDPKQGLTILTIGLRFKKPCLNSVQEKANVKVFVKAGNMSIIPICEIKKIMAFIHDLVNSQLITMESFSLIR